MTAEQALLFTQEATERYVRTHTLSETGLDESAACRLAAGRLEWLLGESRGDMSRLFTQADISALMNCYQDSMFCAPDQFQNMPGDLCDDLGVEPDAWELSSAAPLIRKILGLSKVEQVALGDLLERAWHALRHSEVEFSETLEALGLELAE